MHGPCQKIDRSLGKSTVAPCKFVEFKTGPIYKRVAPGDGAKGNPPDEPRNPQAPWGDVAMARKYYDARNSLLAIVEHVGELVSGECFNCHQTGTRTYRARGMVAGNWSAPTWHCGRDCAENYARETWDATIPLRGENVRAASMFAATVVQNLNPGALAEYVNRTNPKVSPALRAELSRIARDEQLRRSGAKV